MLVTEIHHVKGHYDDGRAFPPLVSHACKCDTCGRTGVRVYGHDTEWYRGIVRARAGEDGFTEHLDVRGVSRLRCASNCADAARGAA
jgi:hypothetical protein